MSILVKHWGKFNYYNCLGRGLKINSFSIEDNNNYYGFINNWEYNDGENSFKGRTQRELIEFIKDLASTVQPRYKRQKKNDTSEPEILENSKNIILIYTDNLLKAKGFLQPIITDKGFEHYFQVCNNIEFRDINQWNDECKNAEDIASYAQFLFDELFIPENDVYLTSPQWARRRIKKAIGKNNIAPTLMPQDFTNFLIDRKAIFGGMHFRKRIKWHYQPKNDILIKYFDITSAYPYVMICKKYAMESLTRINPSEYKKYSSEEYFTIGTYKITYECRYNNISTYKDIYGKNLEYNCDEYTTKIRCCSTDLETICKMCDNIDIQCIDCSIAKIDYLPKEIIDEVIYQFNKKESLRGDKPKYTLQKKVVNSISGDLTRKAWEDVHTKYLLNHKYDKDIRDKYNDLYAKFLRDKCIYSMYWGIQVTAYVRSILLDICQKTDAIYGDTDGLFFYGYDENIRVIDEYNNYIEKELANLGYNINKIGRFKEEDTSDIDNLIVFGTKSYAYTSRKADGIIKHFAGMGEQFTNKIDESIFTNKDYKLDYGYRIDKVVKPEYISLNSFESDGYYYEREQVMDDIEDLLKYEFENIVGRIY